MIVFGNTFFDGIGLGYGVVMYGVWEERMFARRPRFVAMYCQGCLSCLNQSLLLATTCAICVSKMYIGCILYILFWEGVHLVSNFPEKHVSLVLAMANGNHN